jgi:hypothetical protein
VLFTSCSGPHNESVLEKLVSLNMPLVRVPGCSLLEPIQVGRRISLCLPRSNGSTMENYRRRAAVGFGVENLEIIDEV